MKDNDHHNVRQFWVKDSRSLRRTAGPAGDNTMMSVLALTCQASSGKDWTERHSLVSRGPDTGRTDCPVGNTDFL